AVVNGRDQRHVMTVDRIAFEYLPVVFCDGFLLDIGALRSGVDRTARIPDGSARQARPCVAIEHLARRRRVRPGRRDRNRWPRQTDRSQSEQCVLLADCAHLPAEFRRTMEALPNLVGKFRIGRETPQDVVWNDEASASHYSTSVIVNVKLPQEHLL